MKKFVALILATMMVLAVCASACASTLPLRQDPMPAQNVKTIDLTHAYAPKNTSAHNYALYVRHYLWSDTPGYYGSNNHTNYFQAIPQKYPDSRYGGNWMAPDTANYVRSNSITYLASYGVAGRANTKYADAGIPIVRVSGYMDSNN